MALAFAGFTLIRDLVERLLDRRRNLVDDSIEIVDKIHVSHIAPFYQFLES